MINLTNSRDNFKSWANCLEVEDDMVLEPVKGPKMRVTLTARLQEIVLKAISAGLGTPVVEDTPIQQRDGHPFLLSFLNIEEAARVLQVDTMPISGALVTVKGLAIPYWAYRLGLTVSEVEFWTERNHEETQFVLRGPWTKPLSYFETYGELAREIAEEAIAIHHAKRQGVEWRFYKVFRDVTWCKLIEQVMQRVAQETGKGSSDEEEIGDPGIWVSLYPSVWGIGVYDIKRLAQKCGWSKNRFKVVFYAILKAVYAWGWPEYDYSRGRHYGELFHDIVRYMNSDAVRHIWEYLMALNTLDRCQVYWRGCEYIRNKDLMRLSKIRDHGMREVLVLLASNLSDHKIDWVRASKILKKDKDVLKEIVENQDPWESSQATRARKYVAWLLYMGRVPRNRSLLKIDMEAVKLLKPNFKWFMRIIKEVGQASSFHVYEAAARIAIVFGAKWKDWVTSLEGKIDETTVHDAGINLDPKLSREKEFVELLWKYRRDPRIYDLIKALRTRHSWGAMGITPNMPLKEILLRVAAIKYDNVRIPELAMEAARFGYSQKEFEELQDIWERNISQVKYENIPAVEATYNNYRMYRLSKEDPRGLMLGNYTNCCQHPTGAGAWCAFHGQFAENGAFYVVEKFGNIIAQSWTWRVDDVIVFDNVESVAKDDTYLPIIQRLYKEVAQKMIGRLGVKAVHVGTGYDDISVESIAVRPVDGKEVDRLLTPLSRARIETPRYEATFYTDARRQYVLAEEGNSEQ